MPFPEQTPRAFTREGILAFNPNQMGCYGIFKEGTWIYVGKGDIRERMLAHFNGDNPSITEQAPTHWKSVLSNDADRLERELIRELTPVCNERVG